jgi:NAD(P)-dependent dehydrogenase (short-subunit alcohol dehydrogenase family)
MSTTMLLTGGNNGIGYFMTKQWLENGNCAAVLDLEIDNLSELKEQYPDLLLPIVCDVTDASGVNSAAKQTMEVFGSIDTAVHNACVCPFKSLEMLSLDDYRRTMEVNFIGAVILTKAVLPAMIAQKAGRICLTSSGVGVTGFISISAYASSKGAIEAFAKCMRLEYKETGVSFNILHPPLTDTKSAGPLLVPKEFKASAEKVGRGFVKRIWKKNFIITPSAMDTFSIRMSYRFPLRMGALLAMMTGRAKKSQEEGSVSHEPQIK